jgi:hypothetical protein
VETAHPPLGRFAPLAGGCALAAAAVLVTVYDPSSGGSLFPPCAFHTATGLWCPGCGLTRATHHLLHGDIVGALSSNVFTPFALIAIIAAWWAWVRRSFGLPLDRPTAWVVASIRSAPRWASISLLVLVVVYAVVRNIPAAPFDALAP